MRQLILSIERLTSGAHYINPAIVEADDIAYEKLDRILIHLQPLSQLARTRHHWQAASWVLLNAGDDERHSFGADSFPIFLLTICMPDVFICGRLGCSREDPNTASGYFHQKHTNQRGLGFRLTGICVNVSVNLALGSPNTRSNDDEILATCLILLLTLLKVQVDARTWFGEQSRPFRLGSDAVTDAVNELE